MQFPDSTAHAGDADHIQTESAHQEHQRDEPPQIHSCDPSMRAYGDEEWEECKEDDRGKRAAHGKEESGDGAHAYEEPEPDRAIHQAEHKHQDAQSDKEEERDTR